MREGEGRRVDTFGKEDKCVRGRGEEGGPEASQTGED